MVKNPVAQLNNSIRTRPKIQINPFLKSTAIASTPTRCFVQIFTEKSNFLTNTRG